jgi:hypothetical protein
VDVDCEVRDSDVGVEQKKHGGCGATGILKP